MALNTTSSFKSFSCVSQKPLNNKKKFIRVCLCESVIKEKSLTTSLLSKKANSLLW